MPRETIKLSEILRLNEPVLFTPSEALLLSGLTADTLATWYKRQFIPDNFTENRGRGYLRLYDINHVAQLAVARTLSASLPVKDAWTVAPAVSDVVIDLLNECCDLTRFEAIKHL